MKAFESGQMRNGFTPALPSREALERVRGDEEPELDLLINYSSRVPMPPRRDDKSE